MFLIVVDAASLGKKSRVLVAFEIFFFQNAMNASTKRVS